MRRRAARRRQGAAFGGSPAIRALSTHSRSRCSMGSARAGPRGWASERPPSTSSRSSFQARVRSAGAGSRVHAPRFRRTSGPFVQVGSTTSGVVAWSDTTGVIAAPASERRPCATRPAPSSSSLSERSLCAFVAGGSGDPRCRPDHVAVIHNGSSRCRSTDHPPLLLTITTTHAPATDLGYLLHKNPARVQSLRALVRPGPRLLPGGDRASAARRRCCSTSTRSGSCAARAAARAAARPVRQRPAVRRVVVPERRDRAGVRLGAGRALARSGPSWPRPRSRSRRALPAVPCRGGEELLRAPVRAARLRGRRHAAPAGRAVSRSGARARTSRSRSRGRSALADLLIAPVRADPGARRREALLGRRGRGREAAAPRRGLARRRTRSGSRSSAATCAPARA